MAIQRRHEDIIAAARRRARQPGSLGNGHGRATFVWDWTAKRVTHVFENGADHEVILRRMIALNSGIKADEVDLTDRITIGLYCGLMPTVMTSIRDRPVPFKWALVDLWCEHLAPERVATLDFVSPEVARDVQAHFLPGIDYLAVLAADRKA